MAKIAGAPRKYDTPQRFRRAINRYFDSISSIEDITCLVPTGEINKKGLPIYRPDPVTNELGERLRRRVYHIKPSVQGLCAYLGICRDTWAEYAKREGYAEACAAAKLEMERDRAERLGSGKGDQGIIFDLKVNFGWRDRIEIEAGEKTRQALRGPSMTLDEKLEYLASMGLKLPDGDEQS